MKNMKGLYNPITILYQYNIIRNKKRVPTCIGWTLLR
jgi:hypothetical protein